MHCSFNNQQALVYHVWIWELTFRGTAMQQYAWM